MGCFYVVLYAYVDVLWEENVGAKMGLGKCLHASDTCNTDVRFFLETGEMRMQLIKAWLLIKLFETES